MVEEKMDFRPAIAIFVGDAGNAIYDLFCAPGLAERIHEPLRQGIGLLRMLSDTSYLYRLLETPEAQVTKKADLIEALKEAFTASENVGKQHAITDTQQYNMPIDKPHVHIVGHILSPAIKNVLTAIQNVSKTRYGSTSPVHVVCHLCCYASTPDQSTVPLTADTQAWLKQSGVNFCYLYGDDPGSGFEAIDYHYAVAQSLFTLVATGIVAHQQFQTINKLTSDAAVFNYGTLSTSLVSSPRTVIENVCSNYVASLLITRWLEQAAQNQAAVQGWVADDLKSIKQHLEPNSERPGTNIDHMRGIWRHGLFKRKSTRPSEHYQWSDLSLLDSGTQQQKNQRQELIKKTRQLFAHTTAGVPGRGDWLDRVNELNRGAVEAYHRDWEPAAQRGWNAFKACLNEQLDAMVERHWPEPMLLPGVDPVMPAHIIAWANALDQQLMALEQIYQQQYHESEDDKHSQQAVRRFRQQIDSEPTSSALSESTLLSERDYTRELRQHTRDQQNTMPSWKPRLESGILFILIIGWLCYSVVPNFPILTAGIVSFTALIVFFVNLIQHRHHSHTQIVVPRHRLLRFHRFMLANYCERYERKQRLEAVQELRARLRWLTSDFLKEVKEQMEEEARTALINLFKGNPAAQRNIFAINRGIFTPPPAGSGKMASSISMQQKNIAYQQAEEIFYSITAKNTTSTYWKESEKCLYMVPVESSRQIAQNQSNSKQQLLHTFLFNNTYATVKRHMSGTAFQINLGLQELWDAIAARIKKPLSKIQARIQAERQKPSGVFLCRSSKYDVTSRNNQLARAALGEIEFITIADGWQPGAEESTEYLLVAACYTHVEAATVQS